jgi:hypothetical protein
MYAYLANNSHFQPERQVQAPTLFSWLKQKLDARQARQAEKRHIVYLRTFDRHTLEDMGVDIASLGEMRPTLASFNPYAIAISATGFGSLSTHMSSR